MSINYRDFCDIAGRIEAYYKTPLLSHKYDKLEKARELFHELVKFHADKSHRSAGDTVPLSNILYKVLMEVNPIMYH